MGSLHADTHSVWYRSVIESVVVGVSDEECIVTTGYIDTYIISAHMYRREW